MTEKEILKHLNQGEIDTMLNTYKKMIDITEDSLIRKKL